MSENIKTKKCLDGFKRKGCGKLLSLDCFAIGSTGKHTNLCKNCINTYALNIKNNKDNIINKLSEPELTFKICKGGSKNPGCGKKLSIEYFRFRKNKNKYENICYDCEKQYRREYRLKNIEEIKKYQKEYIKNLTEEKRKAKKEIARQWRINNPDRMKIIAKRQNDKRKTNLMKKLSDNFSAGIRSSLEKFNLTKNGISWTELAKYDVSDL